MIAVQRYRSGRFLGRTRELPVAALVAGLPLLLWQATFLLGPSVLLILLTFWAVKNFRLVADYNVENWVELGQSNVFVDVLLNTLLLSSLAAGVALVLAFPFAYGIAFKISPGLRRLAIALLIMPFFTSYVLRIFSWNFMLVDDGPVNYLLGEIGIGPVQFLATKSAVVLGYLAFFFPLVTLILVLTLMNVDRRLVEAANNLGAGRWRSVFSVVMPSVKVGLVLAFSFAFILAFGDVVAPQVMGSGTELTLGMLISNEIKGGVDFPGAAVIALVMVVLLLVIIFAATRLAFPPRREPKEPEPGAGSSETPPMSVHAALGASLAPAAGGADAERSELAREALTRAEGSPTIAAGRPRRAGVDPAREARRDRVADLAVNVLVRAYVGLCFLLIFVPLLSLVVFSFADARFPTLPWPGFTTDWYTTLDSDPEIFPALRSSIVVAVIVAAAATTLGAMAAYFLNRWEFRGKNLYLGIVIIGPCIPLVILALTMFLFLNQLKLSGSLTAVVLSHIGFAAAFAIALVRLRLTEMDSKLEQAAWNLGANELRTVFRVVLPQMAPALAAAFFLTMAVSWDEFVISWFVSGIETTLPVKIYNMLQGNTSPRVNAIGSIVIGLSLVMVTLAMVSLFVLGRSGGRTRVAGSGAGRRDVMEA